MCILFHKWSKWEQYTETVYRVLGRLAPKNVQGENVRYSQKRQKRKCQECGKVQDIEIDDS